MIAALLTHDAVCAARAHIERSDAVTLERQAELSAIPAPTGSEAARGARVAALLADAGLEDVSIDAVGNVQGWHGKQPALSSEAMKGETGNGCVVLTAHLDTVFGPELDVSVSRKGRRLEGPGISDNARGLAALVTLGEAFVRARVETHRPVLFVATVGEEGSGDLRGVRHLLGPLRPSSFIALDGAGIERIVHRALGARRYRVTFTGPGGHSWSAYGVANPAHAVGKAIDLIATPTHDAPRTTHGSSSCSVVRIGGGTSLNSIPQTAWFDIDLRSEDPEALERLDESVQALLERALQDENRRRRPATAPLALTVARVGERPSGLTPRSHPLVQAAVAATRAVGYDHQLGCASTDANIPIALGVPAVALGAGGRAGDAHLPTEWYENDKGALGIVRALLVTAAMAEAR